MKGEIYLAFLVDNNRLIDMIILTATQTMEFQNVYSVFFDWWQKHFQEILL